MKKEKNKNHICLQDEEMRDLLEVYVENSNVGKQCLQKHSTKRKSNW